MLNFPKLENFNKLGRGYMGAVCTSFILVIFLYVEIIS